MLKIEQRFIVAAVTRSLSLKWRRKNKIKIMGLDMYLHADRYVGGYNHSSAEDKKLYAKLLKAVGIKPEDIEKADSPSATLSVVVCYWRKANAIHAWFVKNVCNGSDDCSKSYVSRDHLIDLAKTCKKVLADKSLAEKLLPTKSGFFFGDTEYNDGYYGDLKSTIEQIEVVLSGKFDSEFDFYYRASW